MYTRASSIRSNYTTSSTSKAKCLLPQRIVGGNGSIQHYNTLHMTDNGALKNNNVVNAHCGGSNNWNAKSSWLLNQSPVIGNQNGSTVVEWRGDRKHCICLPKVCYKNSNTTNGSANITRTLKHSINSLYDMVSDETKEPEKSCCCQPIPHNNQLKSQQRIDNDVRRILNTEVERMHARGTISPLPENDADDDDDDDDEDNDDGDQDDVDFRKSIIRINNIYNSCRDMNNGHAHEADKILFTNSAHHQLCHNAMKTPATTTTKSANDINL